MLWAALVAGGVAIVSMAIFGARLTRKPEDDPHDEFVPVADSDDPWAAWQPRPFEEMDRARRPRMWPALASLTGLVLVGGGLAGARQSPAEPETAVAAESSSEPFTITVQVTPTPAPLTPAPTPTRAPQATAKPQAAAPQPAAAAAPGGPALSGSASCSEAKARVSFLATAPAGSQLSYIGVYLDGKVVGGGPVNSTRYEATVERTTTPGAHELEVSAQDKTGKTTRRQWRVNCA